jgi:hypothetical protein
MSSNDLAAAEQLEQALEQEAAALEAEAAQLEAAYLERQRGFAQRRDALMAARRMVQILNDGQVEVPAGVGAPPEQPDQSS